MNTALIPGGTCYINSQMSLSLLDRGDRLRVSSILTGAPAPQFPTLRAGDIDLSHGDSNYADQILGFCAQVSLVDGFAEKVEWMQT
jgi:UDP-glucose 4-epimerase